MTFPTRDANGAEQSDAVLSIMFEMSEKFNAHLPVNIGSYVVGNEGYIGDRGSKGYGLRGTTEGEISMGSNCPLSGGDALTLKFARESVLSVVSCGKTSPKLQNEMINIINQL